MPVVNTTINLVTSGITPTALVGGVYLGLVAFNPGIPLDSVGMTGCFQHNELAVVNLFFPQGAASVAVPFAVPNFVGAQVQAQSAVFDPVAALTPLGAVSSDGLMLILGN